ncbi:MAG TPA: sigma-70 family RNA polymerase sigma factor, partial [Tepidisphaeraceae bacterium]|nr:sigma-70 family RNA polymerase sigma factor [Tepidisphaeraceae bacterium]
EALLTAHQMRLLRYVSREFPYVLCEFTTPEDIVQDVYVKAYANIGNLRATNSDGVFGWMATIARNTMVDLQRRFALRRPEDLTNDKGEDVVRLLERLVVYRRTPSQSAAEHEFMAAVEDSLEHLPDTYREVVRLRHLDGLSVAETSERMNITAEAVHKLCYRGLMALRSKLESVPRS